MRISDPAQHGCHPNQNHAAAESSDYIILTSIMASDNKVHHAQPNGAPKQQQQFAFTQQQPQPMTSSSQNGPVSTSAAAPLPTAGSLLGRESSPPNARLEAQDLERENMLNAYNKRETSLKTAALPQHQAHVTVQQYPLHQMPPNGWSQHQQPHNNGHANQHWVPNGGSPGPVATTPTTRSPIAPLSYGSGGVSPAGTRSLTGSNDSLLSDGSASAPHHSHLGYIQSSNPPLPPKESSRNSASSNRSSSAGSGYLGGTSQTSPHSAGSPVSGSGSYNFSQPLNKRESQMSAYDRQMAHGHFSSDDGALSSPASGRTSSSSISDLEKLVEFSHPGLNGNSPPKFIKDTSSYWYKPDITREEALLMLRDRAPGSFVVRASRCYPGAFGLALKVSEIPKNVLSAVKPGTDVTNELVRHFLIEPSSRGVKLKGCANEPVFGSLSALIYQHSITPLALPCKLIIPTENMEIISRPGSVRSSQEISNSAADLLRQGAACNVLYLGTADTESLTGPEAIERAMREVTQNLGQAVKTSVVHFKVSAQGITLTDNARKIFFRRHYPTASLTYCGLDPSAREPHKRRWDASAHKGPAEARVFGFVAKKTGTTENSCHLFAELDLDQPAPAIVNFVSKILLSNNSSHN